MRSKIQSHELQQQKQKSNFLPMLCSSSSSSKQVKLSCRRCSSPSSSSASVSVSEDPSSPRVGCMGQVKRNNKVVGFPSIISFTTSISSSNTNNTQKTDHHHVDSNNIAKYHKLRSFFSARSLTNSPTAAARSGAHKSMNVRNRSTSGGNARGRETYGVDHHHHHHHHHHGNTSSRICRPLSDENRNTNTDCSDGQKGCSVNLDELDPPLPVVKQVQKEEGSNGERMNLWNRRSGGAPLKSLQLQAINQNHTLLSANTV